MQKESYNLPQTLSDRPKIKRIEQYLDELLTERASELEFIVLFGSMARGNWSAGSDYDLLIGLRGDDEKRLLDRMADFSTRTVNVECFPYSQSEWRRMFKNFHPLLLEALEYGIVLWDRGGFAEMRTSFRKLRESGRLRPWRSGWKISEPA